MSNTGMCTCSLCCCGGELAYPYGLEGQIRMKERLLKERKQILILKFRKRETYNTIKEIMRRSKEIATSYADNSRNEMENGKEKFQLN